MSDKLPSKYIGPFRIKSLKNGEGGYTLPWAMIVDSEGNCFLKPDYVVEDSPHGTCRMPVELTLDGKLVVHVGFSYFGGKYNWRPYNRSSEGLLKVDRIVDDGILRH